MIETIAPELLQTVIRNANVKSPPLLPFAIFINCSLTIVTTSGGATRPSVRTTSSVRF